MTKRGRYIFLVLMAGVLAAMCLLLYAGWSSRESAPSGGTKFVCAGEAGSHA